MNKSRGPFWETWAVDGKLKSNLECMAWSNIVNDLREALCWLGTTIPRRYRLMQTPKVSLNFIVLLILVPKPMALSHTSNTDTTFHLLWLKLVSPLSNPLPLSISGLTVKLFYTGSIVTKQLKPFVANRVRSIKGLFSQPTVLALLPHTRQSSRCSNTWSDDSTDAFLIPMAQRSTMANIISWAMAFLVNHQNPSNTIQSNIWDDPDSPRAHAHRVIDPSQYSSLERLIRVTVHPTCCMYVYLYLYRTATSA